MAAISVTLPDLGESVTEGTITRWLKNDGDFVEQNEPLLEVATDKVDTEVPSPATGRVTRIAAEEDVIAVGTEIATIDDSAPEDPSTHPGTAGAETDAEPDTAGTDSDSADADSGSTGAPVAAVPARGVPESAVREADTESPSGDPGTVAGSASAPNDPKSDAAAAPRYLTPLVRRMAAELGVDLGQVQATGLGGRIRKSDLLAHVAKRTVEAANPPADTPSPAQHTSSYISPLVRIVADRTGRDLAEVTGTGHRGRIRYSDIVTDTDRASATPVARTEKLTRLRSLIASRMVESLRVSAQLTTVVEADVTDIASQRTRLKDDFAARVGTKLTFTPFFAAAAVDALRQYPVLNASIDTDAGTVTYHPDVHLALAVDTDRGLLAPVIAEASSLDFEQLALRAADVAARTTSHTIGADELAGGTFTLTNTGSRGALFDTPIINQPQVAILGTGSVVERPRVVTDDRNRKTVEIRSVVYLALTYDHRLIDGATAAGYLGAVKDRLEAAEFDVLTVPTA
ncbi:2-oxo acid dehydrogenase subunit E2 [Rhodococcoides corynebacterioides]|uniref:2-oxo acid dehydrogenase subunit E2 n=1 Tax=Rhodococcoides corynebacterioides TaxID=53972 RepID=UPI001C9B61F3|nr:2-oxo acid dehydrogenase subunit E2 [Rhodococcus corynebacterioides]MBY6362483.1 2-oxo acid dehydrogenase subunit E2 [Rhodococcus corynebacterioides]